MDTYEVTVTRTQRKKFTFELEPQGLMEPDADYEGRLDKAFQDLLDSIGEGDFEGVPVIIDALDDLDML